MRNELVTVVIPTYRRSKSLQRALKSVINQTYKNIEIIIIDDNTETDYSKKVCEIIKLFSDNRIIYIKNKKNLGGALSRNKGIQEAKGKYVAFLDDDDWYLPENIEKKLRKLNNSEYDNTALIYGWSVSKNLNDDIICEYKNSASGNCIFEAMLSCQAATSQWLCKRDPLIRVGMFSNVPSKQDSTLMLKLLFSGYAIDFVPEVLTCYYEHNNERISMGTIKNLYGELLLREFMRKNYNLIPYKKIDKVEGTISLRILTLALRNKQFVIVKKEFASLMKIKEFRKKALAIFLKENLKIIIRK